jgi:hypothetical protein
MQHEFGGSRQRPTFSQSGLRFETLCRRCNSALGDFDPALKALCDEVHQVLTSRIVRLSPIQVSFRPNAVLRAVLGHMLAAKPQTDDAWPDPLLRPVLLDRTASLPGTVHVYWWVYPHRSIQIRRDFVMPQRPWQFDTLGIFSVVKFYPLGFAVTDCTNFAGLPDLAVFGATPTTTEVEVELPVLRRVPERWPDVVGDGRFIIGGSAFSACVTARPRQTDSQPARGPRP